MYAGNLIIGVLWLGLCYGVTEKLNVRIEIGETEVGSTEHRDGWADADSNCHSALY